MGMSSRLKKKDSGIDLRAVTAAIKAGDERAFKTYFNDRFGRLYNYALMLSSQRHISEDLVQNAFLKLWQNREKLSEDKSIDALMMIIIRNEFLDIKRSVFEIRRAEMEEAEKLEGKSHDLDSKEELAHYLRLIGHLPKKRREVFTLSRIQGIPNAEIAKKLGISIRTVEKHINLAFRFLRENGFDDESR